MIARIREALDALLPKRRTVRKRLADRIRAIADYRREIRAFKRERESRRAHLPMIRDRLAKARAEARGHEQAGGVPPEELLRRIVELEGASEGYVGRIEELGRLIEARRRKARRSVTRKRHLRKRLRFFVVKIRHLRELREQYRAEHPTFEPWMANGCDWQGSNQATRDYIARAVVAGLTATSMRRTYVPPGGSTTSYHLQGKAGDAAGPWEKMVGFQRAEFQRRHGHADALELFGPDNGLWLKNGVTTSGAEGSPLEDLHDTHVHGANA